MPNYKGHLIGGTIAFSLLVYYLRGQHPSVLTGIEWYCCTLVGALFPDIDTKSKGQKLFYRIIFSFVVFLLIQMRFRAVAFVSLVALAPLLIRHRGITHSLWFILLLCSALVAYTHVYVPAYAPFVFFDVLFFFVGALSHLWLDLGIRRVFRI